LSLPLLAAAILALLALGYRFYGRFVAAQYSIDDARPTPAHAKNDGVDFVPTRPFYLLGQHFSAIAAAGPIAGPILAAQQFGWLPAVLWIGFGVVFIGAVHDFSTLIASVRHEGKSIAEVVKANLGPSAGTSMIAFIWVALIYVIVAFTDVTASTFVAGDPDLKGITFDFNQGGAVAMASTLYLVLAMVMGVVEKYLKPPLWLQTVVFVPMVLVAVWAGTKLSTVLVLSSTAWGVAILVYCFAASLTPVWALLQPRGYLGGFVLYLALAIGVVGIFFGGFNVELPAFKGFDAGGPSGLLFPFLFVTIACGACSGFHGLVCSGTTSKQLEKESHAHPVGYGAMLLEGFVAIIALATVMVATAEQAKGKAPGALYGVGLGQFFAVVIGKENLPFAITFGSMAFSTFVFDTLDVSTRLGRYLLQELFGWKSKLGGALATLLTVGVPLAFLLVAKPGSWRSFWTLFGTSNQLLAALSLLGISVWLKKEGRRYGFTFWPMLFVSAVTVSSLVLQVGQTFAAESTLVARINGVVSLLLLALAASLFWRAAKVLFAQPTRSTAS
jgi:carbon starvation protein